MRRLTFACSRRPLWRVPHVFFLGGGADEKNRIERLCLSPYVEEPLNSKVIKRFVPEQRSRFVFFEFRDSYVLCIYVMNVPCTFRIFMYMAMVQSEAMIVRNILPNDLQKFLTNLKILTSVRKCVETELFEISCLNNLERLLFVICLHTKDLLYCALSVGAIEYTWTII